MEQLFITEINYSSMSVSIDLPSHKHSEEGKKRIFLGGSVIPWLLGSWHLQLDHHRQRFVFFVNGGSYRLTPKNSTHFIAQFQLHFSYPHAGIAKLVS